MADRVINTKQWYDPSLLLAGNNSVEWAQWATEYLYRDVAPSDMKSEDWSKLGVITQFDRKLDFDLPDSTPLEAILKTNNRNWLLLQRSATAANAIGAEISLIGFDVSITIPPTTYTMETQPVKNTFGSGEWPHILYYPEEWTQNVARTVTATNRTGATAKLYLGFTFLQVRTN